jgi:dUTP pyrophosphatase
MRIRIKRFDSSLPLPIAEEFDQGTTMVHDMNRVAGFDFYCREDCLIPAHAIKLIPVNNAIAVPPGYFLLLTARSSTSWKKGLMLANGVGIIDPFYSGDQDEIKIQLYNITEKPVKVTSGEVLAQGIIMKYEPVEWEEVDSLGSEGHGGYTAL